MTNISGVLPQADPDQDDHLAPITGMISSRLIVLANLPKPGAPAPQASGGPFFCRVRAGGVARAPAVDERSQAGRGGWHGQGTDQPGAGRAGIRKLLSRAVNRWDNREVLVCLTRTGLIVHDAMVAGARKRNQRLLEQLGKEDEAVLLGHVDRLTDMAAKMLKAEKDLN
jgi:hypothetical protein